MMATIQLGQMRHQLYMKHKEILYKLLKPSLFTPSDWGINHTHPKKQDRFCAVSIILKQGSSITPKSKTIDAILNTQILLLQRVTDGKAYSGEVCLPGGKCDAGETIFQTAVRETSQQAGLKLSESDLIGILRNCFTAYSKPTNSLFAYAAIFYLQASPQITISPEEITNFRWLPVRYFMQDHIYKPINIRPEDFGIVSRLTTLGAMKHFEWPAIDVGFGKNLYGLTLYILAFFISKLEDTLKQSIQRLIQMETTLQATSQRREAVRALKQQYQMIEKYQLKVKELYFKSFEKITCVWKEDCDLTQSQKMQYETAFTNLIREVYPERPRI